MAVIKTEKLWFEGKDYIRKIKCGADGFFSIKLPDSVTELLEIEDVQGKTLMDVEDKYIDIIAKYNKAQTETRKIIAYEIRINSDNHVMGMSISIWADVFIENKTNIPDSEPNYAFKKVPFDERLPKTISDQGSFGMRDYEIKEKNIVEWTPGRHSFFIAIHEAMTRLMGDIDKFKNIDDLLLLADSGKNLLSAPE